MKSDVNPSSSYHAVSLILTMPGGKGRQGKKETSFSIQAPWLVPFYFQPSTQGVFPMHPSIIQYSTHRQPMLYDSRYSANFQQFKEGESVFIFHHSCP